MLGVVKKRPGDTLDYDIDFIKWLCEGDEILDASAVSGAGITVGPVEVFGTIIKVWIEGGTQGDSYAITVTATTTHGRVKEVQFNLRVTEC